MSNAHLIIT